MIGVLADSNGDVAAIDAAYELLRGKGARRFLFAGGRYSDLDEWIAWKKQQARGGTGYSDLDFLADVSSWLNAGEQVERPPAFSEEVKPGAPKTEDLSRVLDKFTRTPERDSLQYRTPDIPKKVVDMLGDTLCCLVHDKNDLDREDLLNANVFIHGKTSEPKIVQIGPRYFVSPGALSGAAEQTCGYLEVADKQLYFSAFRLDGHTIIDRQLLGADKKKTKLSVK